MPHTSRYLWDWPKAYDLRADGFTPLGTPTHHLITRAALDVLPDVCEWLGPEAELLTWCYCGLPDMNWHTYSRFNADPNGPRDIRFPDSRREWEMSRYCGYNDLTRAGTWRGHCPPPSAEAFAVHHGRACSAARRGCSWEAIRLLGVALHYLQDSGSPAHAAQIEGPLHALAEVLREHTGIRIPGYKPRAHIGPAALVHALVARTARVGRKVERLLTADRDADVLDLQLACARACARATADTLADFHRRFGDRLRFAARPPRKNAELLRNGDFAAPDDEDFCPAGWVMRWWDRRDRDVAIAREKTRTGWCVAARSVGARVACLTTWPRAVRVRPGQVCRLSGRAKLSTPGRAGLYAEAYDAVTHKVAEWMQPAEPSSRWRQQELRIEVGDGADVLRVGVFAEQTRGAARFTCLSLTRLA